MRTLDLSIATRLTCRAAREHGCGGAPAPGETGLVVDRAMFGGLRPRALAGGSDGGSGGDFCTWSLDRSSSDHAVY